MTTCGRAFSCALRAEEPKQEYKREAFELFSAMLDRIKFDTVTRCPRSKCAASEIEREELERQHRLARALQAQHAEAISRSRLCRT